MSFDGRAFASMDMCLPWESSMGDQWSSTWRLESAINEGHREKRHKILLIGYSESDVWAAAETSLVSAGYQVSTEVSRAAISQALRSRRIDCIVCITGSRDADPGNYLTQWLRTRPEGAYIPLVAIGKSQTFSSEVSCLYSGADVYCDYGAISRQLPTLVDSLII